MSSKKRPVELGPAAQPRLRVLAGPNGSGKSTIKGELRPEWLGVFVNADEIERELRETGGTLDLRRLGVTGSEPDVLRHLENYIGESSFAKKLGLSALVGQMAMEAQLQWCVPGPFNSYLASVLADAVRRLLLETGQTFTFETVMSSADKVEFMKEARRHGFRVYLYFVATDDPTINLDRVRRRVQLGGHPVPDQKVLERYVKSIDLLAPACEVAHRAYIFDNSGSRHKLLAQVNDGQEMQIAAAALPQWFVKTALWRAFQS